MNIGWHKIIRDLGRNKLRTLLVILSSAVGIFALGLVFSLSNMMTDQLTQDHRAYRPAHITFWGAMLDTDTIDAIRDDPDIASAEGEIRAPLRWKRPGETAWQNGELIARSDYTADQINRLELISGRWPRDRERDLVVEQQSADYFTLSPPGQVLVESGRRERALPLAGVLRKADVNPPQFGGNATFFATPETASWLLQVNHFNLLHIRITSFSQRKADAVAQRVEERLKQAGIPVSGYQITDPNVHWLQQMVDTLTWVLAVLGMLSLALSAFLIINTLQATLAQQVWQIGVMKVVGATSSRIISLYLTIAIIYGLLAIGVAVPLSQFAAHRTALWLLDMLNVELDSFQLIRPVIGLQIGVGLVTPLLAALGPVIHGARITPHEAIRAYGLGGDFGRSWLDRVIGSIRGLPRPLALSLRNTFRRKLRVTLTLFTLTLGAVVFLTVMSTGASLNETLETVIRDLGLDVWVVFDQPERAPRLTEIAKSVPGVHSAEVWAQYESSIALSSGEEQDVYLMGVPPESQVFHPNIVAGRGLLPEDRQVILLNNKIATERGINVGDALTLDINDRESEWLVVGLIFNISDQQENGFVPFEALAREMGSINRGTIVMVQSEQHGIDAEYQLMGRLRETYGQYNLTPSFLMSASEIREQNRMQFNIITYLLLAMALLAGLVGTMGLMGTMSLNVIERRREIGVLRAIGASTPAIFGILIIEGVLLGLISWGIAVPISYPAAQAFSDMVGNMLMNVPLEFSYSRDALLISLVAVIILASLSSLLPAIRAARITVHEALAYE